VRKRRRRIRKESRIDELEEDSSKVKKEGEHRKKRRE
jgi:hypothetical protein